MKLYVDDVRNAPDDSWVVARTVTQAIRTINQFRHELTHISLDHDIGHMVQVDGTSRPFPCGETFEPVAYYIGEVFAGKPTPTVTIHSSNPVGAENMMNILARNGVVSEYTPLKPSNRLEMNV